MQSFEDTFKPLLTNSELSKMEFFKREMKEDFKDVYWSLSVQDVELIYREKQNHKINK